MDGSSFAWPIRIIVKSIKRKSKEGLNPKGEAGEEKTAEGVRVKVKDVGGFSIQR